MGKAFPKETLGHAWDSMVLVQNQEETVWLE